MKDKLILSFYVDTRGITDPSQVGAYLEQVKSIVDRQIDPEGTGEAAAFFFPIQGESRVECINPVLVTEQDAIDSFNGAIAKLNALNEELRNKIDSKEDEKTEE